AVLPVERLTHTQGIAFRVRDTLETDVSHFWPPEDCLFTPTTGRIKCKSPDKAYRADLKPILKQPGAVRWKFKMTKQAPLAPFREPITVTLTYGPGIDRVGLIVDCLKKNNTIICKEF